MADICKRRQVSAAVCEEGSNDVNGNLIAIIVILVLLLVLVGIIYYAYRRIREKISTFSNLLFGTANLLEGIKNRENEVAVTPKSVSSATNLYLPAIMRDFPEFHYDEMKTRAENVLTSYLRSVDTMSSSMLTEGTRELKEELSMRIQALKRLERREHFQNIKIHRTEIHRYRKNKGRVSVVFQSAVEHIHYLEQDGKLLKGRDDIQEQAKYNIEVIYIQDQELVEDVGEMALGLHCPNCGAPIPSLGAGKVCEYCDSPIVEFNMRTWNFSRVSEQK